MLYTKKPVTVEVITFDELVEIGRSQYESLPPQAMPWSFDYQGQLITHENDDCYLIPTLEGTMKLNRGDMLITGVQGEIYPCKPEIFNATYERVSHEVPPLQDNKYIAFGKQVLRVDNHKNERHIADTVNEDTANNIAAALNAQEVVIEHVQHEGADALTGIEGKATPMVQIPLDSAKEFCAYFKGSILPEQLIEPLSDMQWAITDRER